MQKCVWASSVLLHLLCGMFQTRKLLSSEADSKYLPPGCQDRPRIQLSCPTRVKRHRPEDTSHTLIDLSREPEAKKGPEMPKYQSYPMFVYNKAKFRIYFWPKWDLKCLNIKFIIGLFIRAKFKKQNIFSTKKGLEMPKYQIYHRFVYQSKM